MIEYFIETVRGLLALGYITLVVFLIVFELSPGAGLICGMHGFHTPLYELGKAIRRCQQ